MKKLSQKIVRLLGKKRLKISFAESCTGGMVSSAITAINGSSKVFTFGLIVYSNKSKINVLKIPKNNIKKFDVVIGMYHDQVLTPIKTMFNFNAINITLGLPFIRISPDHGPNYQMLGQKKSNPTSLKEALVFLKKINEN